MTKNIFIKMLICFIFVNVLLNLFFSSSTFALGDIFGKGKGFLEAGEDIDETINTTELTKTSNFIYNTLLAIGIMVAIIIAMVLGIQFMMASADEKAKVKEALMPFITGCIVVFGAFTIWKVAVNIGNRAEDSIVPISISGHWDGTQSIWDYVEDGGELSSVPDDILLEYFELLPVPTGTEGIYVIQYNNAYNECLKRGLLEDE